MLHFDTFARSKNLKFYAMIGEARTVKKAAMSAGLDRSQAFRLIGKWKSAGLIHKSTLHSNKYTYTEAGELLLKNLAPLLSYV